MPLFEMLNWDSTVLGVKVAKITAEQLSLEKLGAVLSALKQQNIQLVYWCIDPDDIVSQAAAEAQHGFLVDEKITYTVNLLPFKETLQHRTWDDYEQQQATPDLVELALESGKFSRFIQDPKMGYERFKNLYTQWINNSCNQTIAEGVIIIRGPDGLAGMATVGKKNQRGDIGLLAVAPGSQGKGYGTQLVYDAQAYFLQQGLAVAQVVTQKKNIPACKLYEKCHFTIESIQNFYHFWL